MKILYILLAFFGLQTLQAQLPAYTPTLGLKAFWPFCGNANDASGFGNNGTISGATLTTDRFNVPNNAYSFNGTSDYISTTMTGILGNNPRAVSFWAKTTESLNPMCGVSWGFEQSMPNAGVRYECAFNAGAPDNVVIIGADCAVAYSTPVSMSNNLWHHYVFQWAGGNGSTISQVQIFQDAVLLTTTNWLHNPNVVLNTVNNWPVNFGRIPYMFPHFFEGSLDEIGIWDRVLTLQEIQQLLNGTGSCALATTGLSKQAVLNTLVQVFPNPNNGQFTIATESGAKLKIINALGQTVFISTLTNKESTFSVDLPNGVYVLFCESEQGLTQRKMIIER